MRYPIDEELMQKIQDHLSRLLDDEAAIKADIIKAPEMRPVPGTSTKYLEHQLAVTQGASTGVRQVLNIIRNGDAHII